MKTKNVCIMTLEEAREGLCQFYADFMQDRCAMVEALRKGELRDIIPNISEMQPNQVVEAYGDLCVGDTFMVEHPEFDMLLIEFDNDQYEMVAIKGQGKAPPVTAEELRVLGT